MARAVRPGPFSGRHGAMARWRRAVALVLCACFVLLAAGPAFASDTGPHPGGVAAVTVTGIDHLTPDDEDGWPAHHCAHCACQAMVPVVTAAGERAADLARIRFAPLVARAFPRAQEPPSEPPRT